MKVKDLKLNTKDEITYNNGYSVIFFATRDDSFQKYKMGELTTIYLPRMKLYVMENNEQDFVLYKFKTIDKQAELFEYFSNYYIDRIIPKYEIIENTISPYLSLYIVEPKSYLERRQKQKKYYSKKGKEHFF